MIEKQEVASMKDGHRCRNKTGERLESIDQRQLRTKENETGYRRVLRSQIIPRRAARYVESRPHSGPLNSNLPQFAPRTGSEIQP
jgi:hypothetical protein